VTQQTPTIDELALGFEPWPHQRLAYEALRPALGGLGYCDTPVVAMPTGGGKTRLMVMLAKACKIMGLRLAIYAHRKMLTRQTAGVLDDFGLSFGLRASGHRPDLAEAVQVCSLDTERARTLSVGSAWTLHDADIVIIDEAHANLHATAQTIVAEHTAAGCRAIIGTTATPVGCAKIYNRLILAANNSDLRACGSHVFAETFAPSEPELKHVRRNKTGEYSEGSIVKAIMTPTIVGNIYEHWRTLNPTGRPTILFAPGVDESIWLVNELKRRGVTARHIDHETTDSEREEIAGQSEDGSCQVVSNRFVLREGVDWPWLQHCIFATAFGAVSNYLQAGGRLLRSHPSLDRVTVQDHGGNWHRHGSLNDNRDWELNDTNQSIAQRLTAKRREMQDVDAPEPICCPKCKRLRRPGRNTCPGCGHQHKKSVRMIMQTDGTLKRKVGRVEKYKPKPSDIQTAWNQAFYANRKRDATFNQVAATFRWKCKNAKIEVGAIPFHEDGRAKLRNCPPEGSAYWAAPISTWLERNA